MIAIAAAAAMALPPQWQAWRWSAAISARRGIAAFTLPLDIANKSRRDLGDLRITDDHGQETPFEIVVHRGSANVKWKEAALDDYGFVPGRYTEVVADAGAASPDFATLEISTSRQHFATSATILASDDRQTWRIVRSGAPLFNYQGENLGSNFRVQIPLQHSRWYLIRIFDPSSPFPIDGVRFASGGTTLPELQRYAVNGEHIRQSGHLTVITIDTRVAHLPVSFVRLDTQTPRFSRKTTVEYGDDGSNWAISDSTRFERTPVADHRALTVSEVSARYWRITIQNGNDAALDRPVIELWGMPRHIVFQSREFHRYRIIFGNHSAPAPAYDFAATHGSSSLQNPLRASVGPSQRNSAYVSSIPWSERHPWVLWAALAAAIIAIGGLAVRALTLK